MGIRLTPAGRLRWESFGDEAAPTGSSSLQSAFETDWREALFTLAADKIPTEDMPSVRYWQQLAERYLTDFCHVPEDAESFQVEPLTSADCARWILTAPPMQGGEYLSEGTLQRIWERLDGWVRETVTSTGGLAAFLQRRAPKWHQVGRVCFHLAENRNDEARPFAFMATYASGFGAAGRLKHLPLRKALEQYAGAKNRVALVKLLSPVQQAAEACDWVKDLVDSGDIYRPMAWTAARAYRLLRSAAELEESGLSVRLPNWWRRRPRPQVSVTIGAGAPSTLGAGAVLDFNVSVALGDTSLSPEELDSLLGGEDGLVLLKGQWAEVDRDKLREAIEHWDALQRQAEGGEVSFVEGMRLLAGAACWAAPRRERSRTVHCDGLVSLKLAHETTAIFTVDGRRRLVRYLLGHPDAETARLRDISVDLRPIRDEVRDGLSRLARAREAIAADDAVLSGAPCVRGTRIPAHDIAEMLANGDDTGAIRDAWPVLTEEQIEAAALYARAYPRRGRPRNAPFWRSRGPAVSTEAALDELPPAR